MAQNYILLERIELAASAASVTFSSIPQSGYTDLKIVLSTRVDNGGSNDAVNMALNTDAFTTNASITLLRGTGSSILSASGSYLITGYTNGSGSTANTFGNHEVYIPNYLSSNYKSISTDSVYEDNTTTAIQQLNALLWSNTAAINKITFAPNGGGNFVANSTFSVYGLAAVGTTPAIAPKAIGGNIQTDGTYWYHTFLASGTFTPSTNLTCDVLAIAGGGAGGGTSGNGGGGGGAGGVVYQTSRSVTATAISVTVGAGGTGSSNASGTNGNNSVFDTITANGGGYGGKDSISGNAGGSGGGAGGSSGSGGTANQGNSGGGTGYGNNGGNGSGNGAGGGGGAGAVGQYGGQVVAGTAGNGGAGLNTWSSWASVTNTGVSGYYAGGGAGGYTTGGTGGAGGGGNGGSYGGTTTGVAGTAFTGSGGGGSSAAGAVAGANGGSGIVIVRYAV